MSINPALIDVFHPTHDGYPDELAAGDTRDVLKDACGSASREFPADVWAEQNEWQDLEDFNNANHTWPLNYCDRFTNQNPTHECTCHSLRANFEICRNQQRGAIYAEGPKVDFRYEESATSGSVWVSTLSIYAEANPRQWGGASIRQVLDIGIRRGFLPDKIQPRDYGFKHTLAGTTGKGGKNQSSGQWVPLSRFPEGHEETSKWLRIQEVFFPESVEQMFCTVLKGRRAVCVGRKGHAVPYAIANVKERLLGYIDSYDVIRWDSWNTVRSAVSGAYAIASVTTPDDWSKPVGE